ncbi:MAG: hypothetical protein EXR61_04105 [Chloroflexi bacterium]|nr:hypothetical protein [Chloroflexota bacterium]
MARTKRRREARRPLEYAASTTTSRGRTPSRGGAARASGEPSAALQKAASWERAYVMKDLRRIGKTVLATLVLLALAGVAENALLR